MEDQQGAPRRVPPHSAEAEESIIGGVLIDDEAFDRIADKIRPDEFYDERHAILFSAMSALSEAARPIDLVTMSERLKQTGELQRIGGLSYLAELAERIPTAANIEHYAHIVHDKAVLRGLIRASSKILAGAFEARGETADFIDQAEQAIFAVSQESIGPSLARIDALIPPAVERIETLFERKEAVTGVPSGFADFDHITAGFQPSDLIVVAGRPSMGKTAFCLNVAEYAALHEGVGVAIFSMEMSKEQLVMRMLCSEAEIDNARVRVGDLHDRDIKKLALTAGLLAGAPIYIDDAPAQTVLEVRAKSRRLKKDSEANLGLIVVDYLQLMRGTGEDSREQEISAISRSLKALAKELNVPIVALSQLNRQVELRSEKRPVMADLRECVPGETLVVLEDGTRRPIRDLVDTTPRVVALGDNGRVVRAQADKVWRVGTREVLEVALSTGKSVRATAKHRLYGRRGWARVQELRPGDALATAETELSWDTVVSVRPCGEEVVYDLTVPGPASWLADGIVSHNSGAIEQDADVIAFIYRDEVYNEDSVDRGVAELIVGKQRNGPTGTARVRFDREYARFQSLTRRDEPQGYAGEEDVAY